MDPKQRALLKQDGGAKRKEGTGIILFLFGLSPLFLCLFFFREKEIILYLSFCIYIYICIFRMHFDTICNANFCVAC